MCLANLPLLPGLHTPAGGEACEGCLQLALGHTVLTHPGKLIGAGGRVHNVESPGDTGAAITGREPLTQHSGLGVGLNLRSTQFIVVIAQWERKGIFPVVSPDVFHSKATRVKLNDFSANVPGGGAGGPRLQGACLPHSPAAGEVVRLFELKMAVWHE